MTHCPLKSRLVAAVFVLTTLFCVGLFAQPPLLITTSGYYYTELDASGVPSLVEITTVVDLRDGVPPTTPTTPVDTALANQVKTWSDTANDPQGAQAIAAVYSHIRGAVNDGILDEVTVWQALKLSTDSAIEIMGSDSKWKDFRSQLSALVTEGRQRGTLQTPEPISRMIRSVQHGLELSADGSNALTLDILTSIAAKTNEAIDATK